MEAPTPQEVVVVPVSPDGEQFAIVETQAMVSEFLRGFAQTSTTEERLAGMVRHLHGQPPLTETEVREQLALRGMPDADVDLRIARARRLLEMRAAGPFVFERITRIGYANDDGQEVVRKTGQKGPEGQRVFVLRCRVCAHEYGAYGCDIDIRRCPRCQDGPPGLLVAIGEDA